MPRRYDTDELDDDTDAPGTPWRNRLITWGLAGVALGLGFLIPYTLYLNSQVTQRFGELRWQIPTRVYARPLVLAPGGAMNAGTLKTELAASAYRDDGIGQSPGTYRLQDGRFTISSRGYVDVDGRVAPRRIEVVVSGGQVASLRDATERKALKAARLDPARIATLYGQKQEERRLVRIGDAPELLVTGLQAVEDRDFKSHHGIDLSGIVRAVWVTVRSGGKVRQGASTLTQQLARSGLLGIGKEQTLTRKFNEVLYALIMEARYDKPVILEAYLNQVYLGQRGSQAIHGVASGAEFWFGRDLNALTTEQVALLIGLVKGPSYYDPRRNPERALDRRNFVLGKLHESGLIDTAEYQRALKAPLGVPKVPGLVAANRFPAYIDLVRRQLGHDYPESTLQGAGLNVLTGMSPSAQAYAEGAVAHTVKSLESKRRPELQAGLVLTDVHNGDVLAVVGSRRASRPGLDTARAFARSLAGGGFAITSGLALGIDGAAHEGALEAGGATLAVLGTGLQCLYPRRHLGLARRIVEGGGALLSELPLDSPPQPGNFPRRNRIISGLSLGVLVVEASPASGSLITARLAAEQGREVYAIPGSIHHPGARGCHELIRQGATLVERIDDILEGLSGWTAEVPASEPVPQPQAHPLLDLLRAAPQGSEALAAGSGWALPQVLAALTELELEGKVACEAGVWVHRGG